MEKNTPHCKLSVIKALVEARKVRTTHAARIGAEALGFDFFEMMSWCWRSNWRRKLWRWRGVFCR